MMRFFASSAVSGILLCSTLATAAGAATFTVNSTADTNDAACNVANCTLREAITAANSAGGTDTIDFSLGAGPYTILPLSLLPTVTDPVVIDGATGDPASPRVIIAGFIDLAWGLKITAGSSTVKNLVMNNFRSGPAIELNGSGGSVITGCYLGTDAAGTAAVANNYGVRIRSSSNNLIGGTSSADRNVISGNSAGIWVDRNGDVVGPAPGNRFEGNYIGTNATGDAVVANAIGVEIAYGVNDNSIGGAVAGAGNVISGGSSYGIAIESGNDVATSAVSGIVIQGNFIGTDATGQLDFGNSNDGILVRGGASNITIGGTTAEARNVISGNNRYGVWLAPNSGSPSNNTIQGNYIGTNAGGTAAIGNGAAGLRVEDSSGNLIGAIGAAPSNVISGNYIGIQIVIGSGNQVVGNYIGTDATGTVDLGNASDGISITSSPDNTIGGTEPGAGNLISGNNESGIRVYSSFAPVSTGTIVQGNLIGTKADGTSALGNSSHGVLVGAPSTTVGGTDSGAANTIAFNGWDGVYVDNVASNTILGNSIHGSGYLGIDLVAVAYQVNTNDSCDPDTGGNGAQNFPVLTASLSGGGQVHVDGSLNSLANTDFRLEFFGNAACDSFGNGEGKTYLGSATVTTDGSCNATINVNLPVVVAAGTVVTATATRLSAGVPIETSEFSACRSVTACEYSLSPTSDSFPASGGSRSIGVTTANGCNWPATSHDDWITIDPPAGGNGSGSVSYTVGANGGAARSGSISVAGQTFPVTQDAAPEPLCLTPADCDDLNPCTDDTCDQQTGCHNTPNDANTCSDANACTTGDHCTGGHCSGSTLTCADDNACTDDTCSPSTGCVYTPNDANSCSDANLCTTGDHCSGGQCVPSGALDCDDANPCTQDSCDGECFHIDICGTTTTTTIPPTTTTTLPPPTGACCTAGNCSVGTAMQCEIGTYQGDGTTCDAPGICSACGNGLIESGEVCDDGNTAAGDGCDDSCDVEPCWTCSANAGPTTTLGQNPPGPSICTHDDGASCDDGDLCTVGDGCSNGTCTGNAVMIPAACKWVIAGNIKVQSRTRGETQVTGHICGGRVRLGEFSTTNGDAVATLDTGIGIQISPHAAVSGDIVSGGSAVYGKPRLTRLPGLDVDVLEGGNTAVQSGDPAAIYDTLGTNVRVADCADAQDDIAPADSLLASLPPGPSLGDTFIAAGGGLTLTAPNPGGVNVFDFHKLLSGADATLTLDGAGNPASVFVLRVERKLDLRLRSKIVLSGGAVAGNVILYSQAKCRFGLEVNGLGTVFCPNGKLILHPRTQWQGALVGGRRRVELRDSGILTHVPLQVGP